MFFQISEWRVTDVVELLVMGAAWATYLMSRRTENRESREYRDQQKIMHGENSQKLSQLIDFKAQQERANAIRDEQLSTLQALARETSSALQHITEGLDRRLQMLEDERRGNEENRKRRRNDS